MDVRPGYKQTEVGVIPEDWEIQCVGDVADLQTGPFGTVLKASEYAETGGVPLISVREIGVGSIEVDAKTPRVPMDIVSRLPRYRLRQGDIVFARKGGVDRSAAVEAHQEGWFLGSDGIRARPARRYSNKYLAYQFQSSRIRQWLLEYAIGTTMPSLNEGILRAIRIPIPPTLAEQRAIANALSDADALIESLEQLLAKKRQVKQGAMQALLSGERRLPGFEGEWEETRLGQMGDTFGGLSGKTKRDFGHGGSLYIPFLNIMNNVEVDCRELERVDIRPGESQRGVRQGDLFFNGSSETPIELGLCAVLSREVTDVYLNSFCFGYRLHDRLHMDGIFLAYFFRSSVGRRLLAPLAQGATRYNLSKRALMDLDLQLPPLAEQRAIAAVLSDMDAEIDAITAKLDKARLVKQGMMQELLTGRIRLV